MIKIEKDTEIYFKIIPLDEEGEDDIAYIKDFFTFLDPDRTKKREYLNGIWDGYYCFLKEVNRLDNIYIFPVGLFFYLYKIIKDQNIVHEFVNDDFGYYSLDLEGFDEWLEENEKNTNKKLKNREYQYEAVKKTLYYNRSVLESPTGSGKSKIIYSFVKFLLDNELEDDEKFLVICPNVDLVTQMKDDFVDYGMNEDDIEEIYSGMPKNFNKKVTISTWNSLYKYREEFFYQFSGLVIDEAHKAKADQLQYIAKSCIYASFRLATTGTLPRNKLNRLKILSIFGKKIKTTTTIELVDQNYLTPFHIRNVVLEWTKINVPSGITRKSFLIDNYHEEYSLIINSDERKKLIQDFSLNLWNKRKIKNTSILILGTRVEYIDNMYDNILKESKEEDREKIYKIHGQIKKKKRKEILSQVKKEGGLIVANINILGTGINIPNITTIILANPVKSDISLVQSIGRSIRLFEGKTKALIFDFIDKISLYKENEIGKKVNYQNTTFTWIPEKTAIYDEIEYKYDFIKMKLEIDMKKDSIDDFI